MPQLNGPSSVYLCVMLKPQRIKSLQRAAHNPYMAEGLKLHVLGIGRALGRSDAEMQPFINTLFMKEMITYIFGHILIYNGFCTYTTLFIFTQHFDMLTLMKLDSIEKIMYTLCHCYVMVLLMYTNTKFISL